MNKAPKYLHIIEEYEIENPKIGDTFYHKGDKKIIGTDHLSRLVVLDYPMNNNF